MAAITIPAAIAYAAWRKSPLSLTLAVAMLSTFALGILADRLDPGSGLDRFWLDLAVYRVGPYHSGPLAYVTMMFLHANLFHLLFNLAFLILLGPLLEDRIGPLRWGILFFVGGIVASLVFEAIHIQQAEGYALLGASGALSSVFGAFGRLYPRERLSMWMPIPLPPMPAIYYVIGFVVVQFILSLLTFGADIGVAWEAHVAGLAFGFAAAPLVMRIPSRKGAERVRDFSALRPLAKGLELEEMLQHLSKEPLRDAQIAWLEKCGAKALCPEFGKALAYRTGALR